MAFRYTRQSWDVSTPYCTVTSNVESMVDAAAAGGLEKMLKNRRRLGVRGVMAQQMEAMETRAEFNARMGALCYDVGLLVLGITDQLLRDFAGTVWLRSRTEPTPLALALSGLLLCLVDSGLCAELIPHLFALLYKWVYGQANIEFALPHSVTL